VIVLQENLRQLCVFKLANESGKPWLWWDYVTKFGDECSMVDRTYDEDCAEKVRRDAAAAAWMSSILVSVWVPVHMLTR